MAQASADALPNKGSLKRTPFPKLMRSLARAEATGSLYLLNGTTKKVVFFEQGRPTFVRSNVLEECLGQILAREGLITQQQCDQTLEAIRRTGKKQGELLVEMGILSEGNLRYGLETQLRRKLFDVFAWKDGRFQFKPGDAKNEHGLDHEFEPASLIIAGVLEVADVEAANAAVDSGADRYPQSKSHLGDKLDLQPEEAHFFRSLDGSRSTAEILAGADSDAARQELTLLLHAFISAGAVLLPKDAQPAGDPPDPLADPSGRADGEFKPGHEPSKALKPFEDTPLPGQIPERPDSEISATDTDMDAAFERVANEDSEVVPMAAVRQQAAAAVDQALIDAEPEALEDETFDAEIEIIGDEELEMVEELEELDELDELDDVEELDELTEESPAALEDDGSLMVDDDLLIDANAGLLSMDELDNIDLGGAIAGGGGASDEEAGAMRYTEGEAYIQAGDWAAGVASLEAAYEAGVDIAELHAMLAYGRFHTSPADPDMASHALDLLEYAASMNPNLDLIYAYRGEILLTTGDHNGARAAAEQALRLNEYNDIAMGLMDRLG